MNKIILILSALVTILVLTGCVGVQQGVATPAQEQQQSVPAALDGKALVQDRCTQCHDLGRVESAQKTEVEWKTTVERMVSKGSKLDASEQAAVIQYLAETYPK
ncbi:MAG: hypothetical protein JXA42_19595 [Anaerolineales bacterium]|nr:hypothetical protein [Anaerolineales bacterium]